MPLAPGTRLGPYEVEGPLGEGGMGEVYRARDTRLHRDVAIKVLPAVFASNPERVRRFQQEARAVAALNHPHICQIFDVGPDYIVLEYVDGVPLRGPLSEGEAVYYALQISDALNAAHRRGILHRDLKPSNILITYGAGTAPTLANGASSPRETRSEPAAVKLLDFGIAKLIGEGSDVTGTVEGVVLGTAAYMSPEQAQGKSTDVRSDIFSFGAVLYELVSGRRAFDGMSTAEVLSAVLRDEPRPLSATPALERIVRKCLAKDPAHRYQSVVDVEADLESLRHSPLAARPRVSRLTVAAAAGVVVLLLALPIGFSVGRSWMRPSGAPPASPIQSLAVLPLENLSGAPAQEYFADGMTDALINELARIAALKVISRTSVMPYKGARKPLTEIASELGVDGVIEGSVLQEGGQVRISVKLIDGATDRHVWSDSYQRELRSVLALQNDVARAVAREIKITLTPGDETRLAAASDVNRDAYDAYLRGTQFAAQETDEGQRRSIEALERAVELDPGFAPAHARLALMYATFYMGGGLEPRRYYPKAKAAALRSLEIDDTVADGHVALAMAALHFDWNWTEADRHFRTAIALNPSNAHAHERYGSYLQSLGRFDEALAERQLALDLDPRSPFRIADVGYPLYFAGRHDEAIRAFRSALEMDSRFFWPRLWIGQVLITGGGYRDAIAEIERALEMSNRNTRVIATLGNAYGLAGRTVDAQRLLDELRSRATKEYVSAYYLALIYAGLGMPDRVFEHLDKAIDERQPYLVLLNVEPPFRGLHPERRFQDLVGRIGIPAANR
jgi:serine/threonine-protein kinase